MQKPHVSRHFECDFCIDVPRISFLPCRPQKRKLVVDSGRLTAAEADALSLFSSGATATVRVNAFGIGAGALSAAEFVRLLGAGDRSIGAHEVDLSTLCANLCIVDPSVIADAKSRADADALMALPRPPSVETPTAVIPPPSSCFDFGCFSSSATTDMPTRRDSTGDAANVFASTAAAPSAAHARSVPPPDLSRCLVLRRVLCLLPSDAATTLPSVHPIRRGRSSQSKPALSPSSSSSSLLGAIGTGAVEDTVLPVFPAAELCSVTEDVLPGSRADAMALPASCNYERNPEAGVANMSVSRAPTTVEDAGVLGCQMAYFAIRHFFAANGTLLDATAMTAELPPSFTEESLLAALDAHTSRADDSTSAIVGDGNDAASSAAVAVKTAPVSDRISAAPAFGHSTTRLVHSATAAGAPLRVRVISRALAAAPSFLVSTEVSTAVSTAAAAKVEVVPVPKTNVDADDQDEHDHFEAEGGADGGATRLFLNKFHRFLDFKVSPRILHNVIVLRVIFSRHPRTCLLNRVSCRICVDIRFLSDSCAAVGHSRRTNAGIFVANRTRLSSVNHHFVFDAFGRCVVLWPRRYSISFVFNVFSLFALFVISPVNCTSNRGTRHNTRPLILNWCMQRTDTDILSNMRNNAMQRETM